MVIDRYNVSLKAQTVEEHRSWSCTDKETLPLLHIMNSAVAFVGPVRERRANMRTRAKEFQRRPRQFESVCSAK